MTLYFTFLLFLRNTHFFHYYVYKTLYFLTDFRQLTHLFHLGFASRARQNIMIMKYCIFLPKIDLQLPLLTEFYYSFLASVLKRIVATQYLNLFQCGWSPNCRYVLLMSVMDFQQFLKIYSHFCTSIETRYESWRTLFLILKESNNEVIFINLI